MNFYEQIKKLAKENKKSLNQVENELGYSKNTLYSYKKKKPNADRIEEIAKYFNVTTDYLIGDTPQSREFSAIQRRANNLSPDDQKRLIAIMEEAFNKLERGELHLHEDNDL